MAMRLLAAFCALACLLLFGCAYLQQPAGQAASSKDPASLCVSACQRAIEQKQKLLSGPCLLDPIPQAPGWVCDVVHQPRAAADNLPENQCHAFRGGQASHFVEVSPDCSIIREY